LTNTISINSENILLLVKQNQENSQKTSEQAECRVFLDRFQCGELQLEVVQVGKPFHQEFKELGNYLMPRVGIFCRALNEGKIKLDEKLEYIPKTFNIKVITLSDRVSKGVYEDKSGPQVAEVVADFFKHKQLRYHIDTTIIPDDAILLEQELMAVKHSSIDILITTGGTGIGERDITIDTIKPFLDKEIPGIMEMIRMKFGIQKPNALLSRSVAGVMEKTLVFALPGSVKAVNEYMGEINKSLFHCIGMLHALDMH
jgi:molybdopterin adenylyltransferase